MLSMFSSSFPFLPQYSSRFEFIVPQPSLWSLLFQGQQLRCPSHHLFFLVCLLEKCQRGKGTFSALVLFLVSSSRSSVFGVLGPTTSRTPFELGLLAYQSLLADVLVFQIEFLSLPLEWAVFFSSPFPSFSLLREIFVGSSPFCGWCNPRGVIPFSFGQQCFFQIFSSGTASSQLYSFGRI